MFKYNKTAQWLQSKSEEEKKRLFKACIKLGREQRQIGRQRKTEIQKHREKQLLEKEQAVAIKKNAENEMKRNLCLEISKEGFWTTKDAAVSKIKKKSSESSRKQALKVQLKFRKVVLKQSFPDKAVYQYSKGKKQLTSDELLGNLCKLMDEMARPTEIEILANPKLLVGVSINHRFVHEDGGLSWYNGLVVGNIPDSNFFEVIYFGEHEIYEFELLDDYHNGDLELVPS